MSEFEFEPDVEVDAEIDADADADSYNDPVASGDAIDLSKAPDPLATADVPPVRFGQTVEFPDGTKVENPHTDALGYVYKNKDDWIGGENKHVT